MKRRLVELIARWLVGFPVIRVQVVGYALYDKVCGPVPGGVIYVRDWEDDSER